MAYTPVTVAGTVNASEYNLLQNEVAKLLGAGNGNRGYGQQSQMSSGIVAQDQSITAVHMQNLKHDLDMIAIHQTGEVAKTGPTLSGSDNAVEVNALGDVNAGNIILAGSTNEATAVSRAFNDYQQALENLRKPDDDPFRIHSSQLELRTTDTNGITMETSYSNAWSATISQEIEVFFGSDAAARYFFNAGGFFRFTIKFTSTATGDNISKGLNWQGMLGTEFTSGNTSIQGPGIVEFNALTTTATGSGTPSDVGYWSTNAETTSYGISATYGSPIFIKEGSLTYSANDYNIKVKKNTSGKVFFQINLQDDNTGNPDENVIGIVTSKMELGRALGTGTGDKVTIPVPTISMGTFS